MTCVYLLMSESDPTQRYTGFTDDPKGRLNDHNAGRSAHISKFRPWNSLLILPSRIVTMPWRLNDT
jgi:predicted GIY-YIG superfamily endonuclease